MLGFIYKYLPGSALVTILSEANGVCRVLRLHRETDGRDAARRSLSHWDERIKKQHTALLMLLQMQDMWQHEEDFDNGLLDIPQEQWGVLGAAFPQGFGALGNSVHDAMRCCAKWGPDINLEGCTGTSSLLHPRASRWTRIVF
ncbi:hypothetical protein SVAN01_07215 [Stagonosporopsis vannaccii]|nr:hypothetical protein SVAN01_07215 [Stagonosporopsis vannaccii]